MNKLFTIVFTLFFGATLHAQTAVSGTVTDSKNGEPIPGVNIRLEGNRVS